MFTGIITDVGEVLEVRQLNEGKYFKVATKFDLSSLDIGASVAHAGVCLTVVDKGPGWYGVEAWEEALRLTNLKTCKMGSRLNLERSLKVGDELGGHIVSGHVDGLAAVVRVDEEGEARRFTLEAPEDLAKFIAPKGSVCLDGTSLTVNQVRDHLFDVLLIRHSQEVTTWGAVKVGDEINIEIDTMARYAARLTEFE